MTIFITIPTALIAQPGRVVNTFPSGLVRVDQTYLGLTSQAAAHRATLGVGNNMPDGDSSPCIDGLKIFPQVQERRREDGFTEFIVSAYGRTKTTPTIELSIKNYTKAKYLFIRGTATAKIVSHEAPTALELNIPSEAFDPIAGYDFTDADESYEADTFFKLSSNSIFSTWRFSFGGTTKDWRFLHPGISIDADFALPLPLNLTKTNFGYWTEWVFAYG